MRLQLQFPKTRKYPIAFATILMYLAWHPLGDFVESLIIGWSIVPIELFSGDFWKWWLPLAQEINKSYTFAFFGYFIPVTVIAYVLYFLYKKFKLNKLVATVIFLVLLMFVVVPFLTSQFSPEKSVAYQNDIAGFIAHNMQPLQLWMYFHMAFWFVWMIFPHILGLFTKEKTMLKIAGGIWIIFLIVWMSSWALGKFIYISI
jgi:hypothetical protein